MHHLASELVLFMYHGPPSLNWPPVSYWMLVAVFVGMVLIERERARAPR